MIDRNDACVKSTPGSYELKLLTKEVEDSSASHEILKKHSTDSVCSTTDTHSNISDEFDAPISCAQSNSFVEALEPQSALRASAPEFIPHQVSPVVFESNSLAGLLSDSPFNDSACSGLCLPDPFVVEASDVRNEEVLLTPIIANEGYSDAATLCCYEEWRQYCGLELELPELVAHSFNDPWAHRSSLAEVLATSPPGQLFALRQ